MQSIKQVFTSFHNALDDLYGPTESEAIAMLTIGELTGYSRAKIKAFPDDNVPADVEERLPKILGELKTGKPVQYILGSTEFYGISFLVNPSVLIPRPETEELVEWILETCRKPPQSPTSIHLLDIGTGSGCIAVSLKNNLVNAAVSAIDISTEALKTAERNAVMNNAEINFINADVLDTSVTSQLDTFDVIASNPPYVTPADKALMHTNVNNFEPHTALFVPQDDPLLFYRAIADIAAEKLNPGGYLFFEINESYGKETVKLLNTKQFTDIQLRQDMSLRDRMIRATAPLKA
ncbi:peptide chain release factor N(5)-glutamine methyltransferase [Mucilaginibacter terrenus]|uniref:Release factor glutamine methyltransferase n=1 Tax=Mucilaginibacter terrenus TaxID=2482727 RepID=A0A3E2NUC7_9SPHI|nr:peptide chain release factor N(5)-glutamine methyltransferase [Mucilaginibacter terrenus]RFZ84608.1 peptide chain release factor N(5)-glutamine methyltransferase [Mucilaginibacter terrenus]